MTETAHAAEPVATREHHTLIGVPALMRMAFTGTDLTPLGQQLLQRAADHPEQAETLLDLSTILQLTGHRDIALSMQAQAIDLQQLYHIPAARQPASLRVLALLGPGDLMANTPLEFLVEDSGVTLDLLYLTPNTLLPETVPEHDVLFVAVGESDANQPLLQTLDALLQEWPRPVVNPPGAIAHLSRDGASELLRDAPGLLLPPSVRMDRHTLSEIAAGALAINDILDGGFPVIARPIDSHAGHGLARLDDAAALAGYLAAMADEDFFITPFIDYRSHDGQYRKYRIVLIDGHPYVCHMAISDHWMIHYLNAGMSESEAKRAEEARCMADFDADFAMRHSTAFHAIDARAGLDYLGIDCAETPDGRLLIFEIDTSMVVHAMDPVELFPYKQPQMRKVFDAFCAMLDRQRLDKE